MMSDGQELWKASTTDTSRKDLQTTEKVRMVCFVMSMQLSVSMMLDTTAIFRYTADNKLDGNEKNNMFGNTGIRIMLDPC